MSFFMPETITSYQIIPSPSFTAEPLLLQNYASSLFRTFHIVFQSFFQSSSNNTLTIIVQSISSSSKSLSSPLPSAPYVPPKSHNFPISTSKNLELMINLPISTKALNSSKLCNMSFRVI